MNILDVLFEKSGYWVPPHPSTVQQTATQSTGGSTAAKQPTQQTGSATVAKQPTQQPTGGSTTASSSATQQTGGATVAKQPTQQPTGGSTAAQQTATQPAKPHPILGSKATTQATQTPQATAQPTQTTQQPVVGQYDPNEIIIPFSAHVKRPRVYFVNRPQYFLSPLDTASTEELYENIQSAFKDLSKGELTNLAHLGVLLLRSDDTPTRQIGEVILDVVREKNIDVPAHPDLARISEARVPTIKKVPTETPEDWSNVYENVSGYLQRIVNNAQVYLANRKIQPTKDVQVLPRQGGHSWSGRAATTDWSSYLGPAIGALLGAGIAGLAAPEQNKWLYVLLGALLGGGGGYLVQKSM